MSAQVDPGEGWARFNCPVADCEYFVMGNFGQEADDAIGHIEEDHWSDEDLSDEDRALLVADAATLGFDPVGPSVTCFCGGQHITGSCLTANQQNGGQ